MDNFFGEIFSHIRFRINISLLITFYKFFGQAPGAQAFRPNTALIALTAYQHQPGVNPATYVMAPPTASASPIVTPTSVYPTSTYHPYPPPATPVAAAAAPVQVYDANTKTSYYAQPPVSQSFFSKPYKDILFLV